MLLELALPDGSTRPWHAHVTEFGLQGSDGGLARYRLVLEPWLALLAHRQDAWVFQGMSVPEIIDEVFADHQGQGTLAPAWRWALEDPAAYPQRSLCVQYQESDLAFVSRLLREEGIVAWFEHSAEPDSPAFGSHTLVLADHNAAFLANAQAQVRYTQSGLALAEDSLTGWRHAARTHASALAWASPDHRTRSLRPLQQLGSADAPSSPSTGSVEDVPGAYAYPDTAQGERLALRQMQAIEAHAGQAQASGPWRQAACGTHFTLTGHPQHSGLDDSRDSFVVLHASHRMRNNLHADHLAQLAGSGTPTLPNASDEPLHHCSLRVQPLALPVRPPLAASVAPASPAEDDDGSSADAPPLLKPRPSIHGAQTAIVVGLGQPMHTDRDHRIKVQFHWQRGASASGRQPHPAGSNAPASDASGTWVRVSESVAGANWGAHFVPRVGQEVLVGFVGGDIDRPVVLGSVYNGRGQPDAQGNAVAAGGAGSTGNAPAWFPGAEAGHDHPAVLAGHKSQELAASASGTGGHNQLVLDDSPGRGRIELASTTAQARLQLGHLRQQQDNALLQPRGHGMDLATTAHGALRAGSGLLLATHPRGGQPMQMDAHEPRTALQTAQELLHTLAGSAVQHHATLAGQPPELPAELALKATGESLAATQAMSGSEGSAEEIGGGLGTVPAWARPDLVLAAPAGIAAHTPADFVASAGATTSLIAGQDIQHLAQAHHALAAKDGLVLYTYGQAQDPNKRNQETGLALHAASGNVNLQAQTGAAALAAEQAVNVASTQAMVRVTAPAHVLLTAAGAAIEIKGDAITLKAPGDVQFRASMKEWAGAGSASGSVSLRKPGELYDEAFVISDELTGDPLPLEPYHIVDGAGTVVAQGVTTMEGLTTRVFSGKADRLELKLGWPQATAKD